MIPYEVPINAQRMTIGVQGENNVREFLFDVTEWRNLTGDIGAAEMVVQRNGDSSPYATVITMKDENTVSWVPTSVDTAKVGAGKIQLMWFAGSQIVKTKIFDMKVDPALDYKTPDDSLDPWASWMPGIINADANYKWLTSRVDNLQQMLASPFMLKGTVATVAALADILAPDQNDCYYVEEENCLYGWTGSSTPGWVQVSYNGADYAQDVADINNDLTETIEYITDFSAVLTSNVVRAGYYNSSGEFSVWHKAICTKPGAYLNVPSDHKVLLDVSAVDGRYIAVFEYDGDGTFVGRHGNMNPNSGATTSRVVCCIPAGHKVHLAMGFWNNSDSDDYINDTYLSETFSIKYGVFYPASVRALAELSPTGDNTDRSSEILSRLNQYGVCYLQKGTYYTAGISMPAATAIVGQGAGSILKKIDNQASVTPPVGNQWSYGNKSFIGSVDIQFSSSLPPGTYLLTATIDTESDYSTLSVWTYDTSDMSAGATYSRVHINKSTGRLELEMRNGFTGITLFSSANVSESTGVAATFSNISLTYEGKYYSPVIDINDRCTVEDLSIDGGSEVDYPALESDPGVGYIHGVGYRGSGDSTTLKGGCMTRLRISGCNGGGIRLYNTGYSIDTGMKINDCTVSGCYAGLLIPYWSEFHKVSTCAFNRNYYGCINNGGNNSLDNCGFDGNQIGFMIDGVGNKNSSHGQLVGATMQHSIITPIIVRGTGAGWVFSACNIDNGDIVLDGSNRIVFSGINFMDDLGLDIKDCPDVLFNACMFRAVTAGRTSISNSRVYFNACYDTVDHRPFDPTGD